MEENQKSAELLNRLALITEGAQEVIKGKVTIVFEVERQEFFNYYSFFEKSMDATKKEFKVEISGTDFIFLLDE
jgi:hypothetical protein